MPSFPMRDTERQVVGGSAPGWHSVAAAPYADSRRFQSGVTKGSCGRYLW
jgi:hypothetical protein